MDAPTRTAEGFILLATEQKTLVLPSRDKKVIQVDLSAVPLQPTSRDSDSANLHQYVLCWQFCVHGG
jgi:hypothetical protein